jgi:hypothetical protein
MFVRRSGDPGWAHWSLYDILLFLGIDCMKPDTPKRRGRPPGSLNNKTRIREAMLSRALEGSPTASAEWRKLSGLGGKPEPPPPTEAERLKLIRDEAYECLEVCGLFYEWEGMDAGYRNWMNVLSDVNLAFLRNNPHEAAAQRGRAWFTARGWKWPLDD